MAEATLAPINLREGESVTLRRDENFVVVNEGHYSFRYAGPFVTITRECDPANSPQDHTDDVDDFFDYMNSEHSGDTTPSWRKWEKSNPAREPEWRVRVRE